MAGGDEEIRVVATLRDELSKPLAKIDKSLGTLDDGARKTSEGIEDIDRKSRASSKGVSALQNAISTSNNAIQKAIGYAKKGAEGFGNVAKSLTAISKGTGAGRAISGLVKGIQSGLPKIAGAIKNGLQGGLEKAGAAVKGSASKVWGNVAGALPETLRSKISSGVQTGISKAKGFFRDLPTYAGVIGSEMGDKLGRGLSKAADKSIDAIKGTIKSLEPVAAGVMGAIGGLTTTAFVKGFSRLSNIENAKNTLTGLGNSAKVVEQVMNDANESVLGTAYGLDEAASIGAQLVAAGIKPGKQLAGTLKTIADTATIGNDSMQNIGAIYSKVAATGRLQGDEIMQFTERGIPVLQLLSKELGKSTSDVQKMVTSGEVDFATFASAMNSGLGGAAQESGKTLQGALANTGAALGRIGAVILTPFYEGFKGTLNAVMPVLDNFKAYIEPIFLDLTKKMQPLIDGFNKWLSGLQNADIGSIVSKLAPMAASIGALAGAFVALGSNGIARFLPFISGINPLIAILGGLIIASPELQKALLSLAMTVGGVLLQGIQAVNPILQFLAATILPGLAAGITIVANFLAQNKALVAVLLGAVGAIMAVSLAYRGYQIASAMVSLALGRQVAAEKMKMLSEKQSAIATGIHTVALKAKSVALRIGAAATWVATGAQKAFNLAMRANPIGLIITGIMLLVGALIWFFTKTETGKKIWASVWGAIKTATAAVVSWFQTSVLPFFSKAWSGIITGVKAVGAWFVSVWNGMKTGLASAATAMSPVVNFIKALFNGIVFVIKLVVTIYLTMLVLAWKAMWFVLSNTAMAIWNGVLKPVFNGIMAVIRTVRTVFTIVFTAVKNAVVNSFNAIKAVTMTVLGPVIRWITNYVKLFKIGWSIIWTAIKTKVSSVWAAISSTTRTIFGAIVGWIKGKVNALKAIWSAVWNAIKLVASTVWNRIKSITMSVFSAVYNWISGKLSALRNLWSNIWGAIKTKVKNIWDGIKSVIHSAWTWIRTNIFDKMKPAINAIGKAFEKFRDTAKAVWDKIKEQAKSPVKFVVNTIYRDNVKKTFDKIAGAVGLKLKLPDVKLNFAKGGTLDGALPGYTPGRDIYRVPSPMGDVGLGGGESIMRPEFTKGMGRGFVNTMNAAARKGVGAVRNTFGNLVNPGPPAHAFKEGGTLSDAARWLQGKGAKITEFKAWGQRVGGHSKNSMHYSGNAFDANTRPGQSQGEMNDFDRLVPQIHKLFPQLRTLWRVAGHFNHLHVDTGRGGKVGSGGSGGGGGGLLTSVGPLEKLMGRMKEVGKGAFPESVGAMGKKVIQGMLDKINPLNWFGGGDDGKDAGPQGGGVARWRDTVIEALKLVGQPTSDANINNTLRRMKQESGGNPRAINNWDSNARRGTPSKGLMQVIGPTFASNRLKSLPNNIWNPLANIVASMRYALGRYGSLGAAYNKAGGYAEGGIIPNVGLFDNGGPLMPGQFAYNAGSKPELVTSDARAQAEQRAMERVAQKTGAVASSGGSGGNTTNVSVSVKVGNADGKSMRELEREFEGMMERVFNKQNRRR